MRLTEPGQLVLSQLAFDRPRDLARRSEQVDVRALVPGQRPAHRRGDRIALDRQRGVAGPGGPGRGRQRPFGAVGRVEHDVGRGLPARGRHEAVDRGGPLEGVVALYDGRPEAVGASHVVADPDHLRVLREVRALGGKAIERVGGHRRQVVALGQEQRGADRRAGQDGRGDRRLPVLGVDQHHCGGAVRAAGGREQGARDAGGVGDRVRAAHADRVAGGAGREAELLGPLVVLRLHSQLGRAPVVVAERAATEQTEEEQRDGQATHGGAD